MRFCPSDRSGIELCDYLQDVSPQLEEHREDTSRFWTASAWLAYTAKLVYSTAGVCAGILEGCKLAAGGAL